MKLSDKEIADLGQIAISAAATAAQFIRTATGQQRDVSHKKGGSSRASQVVTEVDIESQRLILAALAASLEEFGLGILAEENPDDSSRHECDLFWCIDPLDGTLPFIESVPGYSVSIALVSRAGDPVFGVIHDPVSDFVYHAAAGAGAFRNGIPWTLRPAVGEELTLVIDRSFYQHANYPDHLAQVEMIAEAQGHRRVKIIDQGGAAMNAMWVIENAPAIYFKLPKPEDGGGSLWDYAASACIFRELGAVASDIDGNALRLNRPGSTFMNRDGIIYASHPPLGRAISELHGR